MGLDPQLQLSSTSVVLDKRASVCKDGYTPPNTALSQSPSLNAAVTCSGTQQPQGAVTSARGCQGVGTP